MTEEQKKDQTIITPEELKPLKGLIILIFTLIFLIAVSALIFGNNNKVEQEAEKVLEEVIEKEVISLSCA